jgi:DNA polymerase III delta subunit
MIILLTGKDGFRIVRRRKQLKDAFREKYPDGEILSVDAVEYPEKAVQALAEIRTPGLFAAPKFLSIENSSALKETERIETLLDGIPEGKDAVVLFSSFVLPKGKSTLLETIQKKATKTETFDAFTPSEAKKFLLEEAKDVSEQVSFSVGAAEKLLAIAGADSARLSSEARKLAAWKAEGEVTREDVDAVVGKESAEENIFNALDALLAGRRGKALSLLLEDAKDEGSAVKVFGLLAWQLREFFRVRGEYDKGNRVPGQIAAAIGGKPYSIQKIVSRIPVFPVSRLKKAIKLLAEIDVATKTGKMSGEIGLALFVEKL